MKKALSSHNTYKYRLDTGSVQFSVSLYYVQYLNLSFKVFFSLLHVIYIIRSPAKEIAFVMCASHIHSCRGHLRLHLTYWAITQANNAEIQSDCPQNITLSILMQQLCCRQSRQFNTSFTVYRHKVLLLYQCSAIVIVSLSCAMLSDILVETNKNSTVAVMQRYNK